MLAEDTEGTTPKMTRLVGRHFRSAENVRQATQQSPMTQKEPDVNSEYIRNWRMKAMQTTDLSHKSMDSKLVEALKKFSNSGLRLKKDALDASITKGDDLNNETKADKP